VLGNLGVDCRNLLPVGFDLLLSNTEVVLCHGDQALRLRQHLYDFIPHRLLNVVGVHPAGPALLASTLVDGVLVTPSRLPSSCELASIAKPAVRFLPV
jgi:hypothetical protein